MATSVFSRGYKKKPKGESTQNLPPPLASTHETGGTSGDLSIPNYVPETPVVWDEYENLGSAGTGALPASVATDPVKAVAPLDMGPDPKELAANLLAGNLLPKNTTLSSLLGDEAPMTGGVSAASIMDEPKKPEKVKEPKKEEPQKIQVPQISDLGIGDAATRFAQAFAKYSGMDPRVAAGWVLAEGAGEEGTTGGEAGRNNWLAAGYPGEKTAFSESPYFAGTPEEAAKHTVEWMEGKIGKDYDYYASEGIQDILPKIRGRNLSPEDQVKAIGESGWLGGSAGELPYDYMNNILSSAGNVQVTGHEAIPASSQAPSVPGVPAGMKRLPSSVWFGKKAENKFGLDVRENPYFDPVDPVHTEGSYHYQRDKQGRGEAIDVSGDPDQMMAFDRWVAENYPGVTELFYDPGISLDEGNPSGPIGGHSDHVHVSAVPGTLFPMDGSGAISVPEGGSEFTPFSGGGSVAAPEGGGAPEEILNAALETASTPSEPVTPTTPSAPNNNLQIIMDLLDSPTPTIEDPTSVLKRKDDLLKLALLGRA